MNFSSLLDISGFFIGLLINILLIALITFFFKRKITAAEKSIVQQSKTIIRLTERQDQMGLYVKMLLDESNHQIQPEQPTKSSIFAGVDLSNLEDDSEEEVKPTSNVVNEDTVEYTDDVEDTDDDYTDDDSDDDDTIDTNISIEPVESVVEHSGSEAVVGMETTEEHSDSEAVVGMETTEELSNESHMMTTKMLLEMTNDELSKKYLEVVGTEMNTELPKKDNMYMLMEHYLNTFDLYGLKQHRQQETGTAPKYRMSEDTYRAQVLHKLK